MLVRRKKPEHAIQETKGTKIDLTIEANTILGGKTSKMMVTKGLRLIHDTSEQIQEEYGSETTQYMEEEADQGSLKEGETARDQIVNQDEIVGQEVNSGIEVSPWIDQRAN